MHKTLLLLLITLGAYAEEGTGMTFPGESWQVVEPAAVGIDTDRLAAAIDGLRADLKAAKGRLDNALLIRRGRLVWQTEAAAAGKVAHIWSATKSVASCVLGAMVDRELCTLDTRIADHLPQYAERYGAVTLRHCFTMTSAIRYGEKGKVVAEPYGEPGTVYGYCDRNIAAGGRALERIAGKKLDALFAEYLGDPIGMRVSRWSPRHAAFGIHTTARDFARLGHLILNRGMWDETRVLSEEWIEQAIAVQVPPETPHVYGKHLKSPVADPGRYGIAWWLNGVMPNGKRPYPDAPEQVWKASGYNGNRLFVIPEWKAVFVILDSRIGAADDPRVFNVFFRRVGEALADRVESAGD